MNAQQNLADFAGRVLISAIFLASGLGKIAGYAGAQGYMEAMGVPGALLPLVIALEVGGAIAIIVGYRTRLAAFLLAAFCALSALIFHRALGDQVQFIMFMKNLAIAGGFLLLVARGPGEWSLDARREAEAAPGRKRS
ncbi:MAG: DoxX family protein [Steroidobacteraceae bacterium]|nr:DoxX family protein [Steroidobacteraceae bacterium]